MGKKKKETEAAAPMAAAPPAKSATIRRFPGTVEARRPLVPADYENIQRAMVARNRQRIDLATELEAHNAKVKETRRKISALAGEVEADLLTIESGTLAEERPCICLKDSSAGTIISMDPETGEIHKTENLPYYQRDFAFARNADDDCHSCKYLVCLMAARGGDCESFEECRDCPGFCCVFADGGRCGFGKHDPEAGYDEYPGPYDLERDCFFCPLHGCEHNIGEVDKCPVDDDGRRVDCYQCGQFTCSEPEECEVVAKNARADSGDAASDEPEVA